MKGTLVKVYNHDDETAVIVYRDENLEKKKIVKTDMTVDYYLLNEGADLDIFAKQEDTTKFEAPYSRLVESIVSNLDNVDPVFKQKADSYMRFLNVNFRGNKKLKKNVMRLPGIYGAGRWLRVLI